MPATHRKVKVTTDHPQASFGRPVVLVDGELLYGVTRIELDMNYNEGPAKIKVTLMGVDVDLEGAPEYLVRVIGPSSKPEE